uniref:ATP synthase F0 subunit 8 n=1 Tax=Colpocephalum griffoneae TaxID=2358484 RepID=A0A386B2D1_9NEOP|nr:ATP synthase F0 subunit 8 [Colpocephalum griffoneae]AYC65900.1 ATP synthase F0 subunit 8 [Colpocephalum griffoneae]
MPQMFPSYHMLIFLMFLLVFFFFFCSMYWQGYSLIPSVKKSLKENSSMEKKNYPW